MLFVGDDRAEDHHDVEIVDDTGGVLDTKQPGMSAAPRAAEATNTVRGLRVGDPGLSQSG
jgi:hypothetical protein